jgi:hypothetical protein
MDINHVVFGSHFPDVFGDPFCKFDGETDGAFCCGSRSSKKIGFTVSKRIQFPGQIVDNAGDPSPTFWHPEIIRIRIYAWPRLSPS